MTLSWTGVNFVAVLVSVVAHQAFGGLWYSKAVCGKAWIELTGVKMEDIKREDIAKAMTLAITWGLVKAYALALLIGTIGITSAVDGMVLGALLGLGAVLPAIGTNYAFEAKPPKMLAITTGNHAIGYVIMGAILGAWR